MASGLEHFDESIYAIDQRIGQLALACGADLSRAQTVIALIRRDYAACGHAGSLDPRRRDELRALLMLKYRIEESCVASLGNDDCRRLIDEQDERLRRRGFPPHAIPGGD